VAVFLCPEGESKMNKQQAKADSGNKPADMLSEDWKIVE